MCPSLFFLELALHPLHPRLSVRCVNGCPMYFVAFLHCFLYPGGILGDCSQLLPELCAGCCSPPRVLCWLVMSLTTLALPFGRTMVPGWLPLNPCEGGEYSSPCCYNWALCWVPQSPLHLLPLAKASRALAVAQWSYCPNPETFLASTLSGSSRCWDFSDS